MFSAVTDEMLADLGSANLERFNYIKGTIEQGELTPPLVVRKFSDLAFSLAIKSMDTGKGIEFAEILKGIFRKYLESSQISIDTKNKMESLISETELDLIYAGGNHRIASLRLGHLLMARK